MLILAAGCTTVEPPVTPGPETPPEPWDIPRDEVIGHSVEGWPIEMTSHGSGPETILILAGIHGNEPAGASLVRVLNLWICLHPETLDERTVLLVPHANPDGLIAGTRRNASGVDLNRNFPAKNHRSGTPLSEPESRALHKLILARRPALVVSIHQPLALIDHDGPAGDIAAAMAMACGLPARKLGARPGSMGSFVGVDLGIPIVTVELPPEVEQWGQDALWDAYGEMLLVAIRSAGR